MMKFVALVLAIVFWTPAFAQAPSDSQSQFKDVNGRHCTPGAGVTICPTLRRAGNLREYADIVLDGPDGADVLVAYCVTEKGAPKDLEIINSSGRAKTDARLLKHLLSWRYNPGTINGVPALICGVKA